MEPRSIFAVQFVWFLLCWAAIGYLAIWRWADRLSLRDRLSLFIAPDMFRVLGTGLLVPSLSPGMPADFAFPTAIGDSFTSVLALTAFVALRRARPGARLLSWAATVFGSADLLFALPHAARAGAAAHLAGQWYVPALFVPLMLVAHVACLVTLVRDRRVRLGP